MPAHTDPLALAPRCLTFGIALLSCAALIGCGEKDWHAETHPTRGRVIINGQPAAGAVVELHSTGEKKPDVRNSRPWGIVQQDGTFTLSTYESGDGAPPGEYAITVRWPPDVNQPSLEDRLGGAYTKPDQSKWRATITEGDNELPPVEITGARVQAKGQAGASSPPPTGPPMPR